MSHVDPSKSSSTSPPQIPFHVYAFLARLREMGLKVQKNGSGWLVQCPAHPDRNPSMTVGIGNAPEYKVLVSCKTGCKWAGRYLLQALQTAAAVLLEPPSRSGPAGGEGRAFLLSSRPSRPS